MKPVLENNLIGDRYFLTKQTANLMEDFAREINKNSSLFLLYGVGSVGKSRLLRELANRGIQEREFCWINFKSNRVDSETSDELSNPDIDSFIGEIQKLMEAADERNVIIVDHFELGSNKAKHQIFQSWTTDGIDKKINLIIATTTSNFSEVRQLSQQYEIKIKSFQLMPCSMAEVEAFLGFYLFPKSPLNALSIPADIKKQLRNCNGMLGKVIEVANQQGKRVSIKPGSDSESKNHAPIAAGLLLLILIAGGISYQYWQPGVIEDETLPSQTGKTITIISDNEDVVSINQAELDPLNSTDDASPSVINPQIADQKQGAPSIARPEIQSTGNNSELESGNNATIEKLKVESPPILVEAKPVRADESEKLVVENGRQQPGRFQRELDNALRWIKEQDENKATIQIMTIGFENFNSGVYHRYLDSLVSKNIDVSGIRIYKTAINDSIVYGVIYGVYETRREASKYIQQLPDALKARRPIPRTIGGIWNEINSQ